MPIPALLAAAPGLLQAGASLFGSKKRKAAEAAAQERFDQQSAALENFQFENPYANQENVYEDATINQQADQFQAQQADQALAGGLDAIVAGGGGGGGAQAIAQAALQSAQGRGANIAAQEQANQANALREQSRLNTAEAQGAATLQGQQHGQIQQQFNLAQQDLSNAQAARQQATQQLTSGLTSAIGAGLGAHFSDEAVAGRQANRAARQEARSAVSRLKDDMIHNSALKRLYGQHGMMESPLNQGTEYTFNKETGKYEGEGIERTRTGRLKTGVGRYGKLRALYGDESYAPGGEDSKRLTDTAGLLEDRAAWEAAGNDPAAFHQNYLEKDSELGRKYLDRQLASAARVKEDEAAFRAAQDEAFAGLDDATRRGDVAKLEEKLRADPELWRQLTGDTAAAAAGGGVFDQVFRAPAGGGPRDLNVDQFHQVLSGLEKAGKNPREYLRFLNKDVQAARSGAPTKRMDSPLYRMFKMKWKGMYK